MTRLLSTFSDNPRVVVVGATGGIGAALVRLLAAEAHVVALSRRGETVPGAAETAALDLLDEDSIAAAAAAAGDALDLVIVATGVLQRRPDVVPEKTWRQFSKQTFDQVFAINTTGPALVAKHFLPLLGRRRKAVFAALSAR
ncbi:MAG: SDR family NAD(P)-dependent oxidoreductase, partial [Pseudomonadota bacterium]